MVCVVCENEIALEQYECSECGAIVRSAPARLEKNRPKRELVAVVESQNNNGEYRVERNPDGSYSCDCLSFLFQRGTKKENFPFTTCKHIRERVVWENGNSFVFTPPSSWQKTCLKKLGVNVNEHLTNAQAYFILSDIIERQGLNYKEFKRFLINKSNPQFLPLKYFGVEFEGGLGCSKSEFQNTLAAEGVESIITGYDHTLYNKKWKLASDSSIIDLGSLTPVEVVTPKLHGTLGFDVVKKVLELWNETLPFQTGSNHRVVGVNHRCGTHLHVDAYNWDFDFLLRLAKVWAKIEKSVVWFLVSPSRRNNTYCKSLDFSYLQSLAEGRLPGDRYYSLNLEALPRQSSVEFRIHNGTLESTKIIPWIVFCLKLVDAVEKGLTHRDFEATFNGVMNAIGMNSHATPIIKSARDFLWGRFQHWKEDAFQHPSHVPSISIQPLDVDSFEAELRRREIERRSSDLRRRYSARVGLTTRNLFLGRNAVRNLASMRPSSIIAQENFIDLDENTWAVPSRDRERTYHVTLTPETDTLSCNCRGFRTHGHCYHSINLARFLWTQRELAEIEEVAMEVEENV